MKTYHLKDRDTLVISVNGAMWQTITFNAGDFKDPEAATAQELSEVINRSGELAASVNEQGVLVLATVTAGGHTSLDVDVERSIAAGALGLNSRRASAHGEGLQAARLVGTANEPFPLPLGSILSLIVDGHRRKVTFDEDITKGKATAAEVARVINAKKKKIAEVTSDGRISLTSNLVGAGSKLEIEAAPPGKVDAALILGFTGASRFSEPHPVAPAKIVCGGLQTGIEAVNLTSSPIELHFSTGTLVLPARSSVPLSSGDAANSQLQRLIKQGVVRLASAAED